MTCQELDMDMCVHGDCTYACVSSDCNKYVVGNGEEVCEIRCVKLWR